VQLNAGCTTALWSQRLSETAARQVRLSDVHWQIESISNCFIVRLKADQRAGQLSLPHAGITKTERNGTET